MSSIERTFQPQIVSASGSRIEGNISAHYSESTQQPLCTEVEKVTKSYGSAILGLTPELTNQVFTSNQPLPSEQSVTLDINEIRAKRREQFEQTGYIPPIAGGSPRKRISPEEQERKNMEAHIARAAEVGLPESATPEEIQIQRDRNKRKVLALALGWPLDPELTELLERSGNDAYPTWETILYHALHISGIARNQIPTEEIADRIKATRRSFRKMDKKR